MTPRPDGDRHGPHLAASLRVASISLLCTGLAVVSVLHLVRPELPPMRQRISEYALGPYAPLMKVAFVATGAGILALAWPLARVDGRCTRAVPALLAAAGTGMVVAGIFTTDPTRSGATADAVHSHASALATIAVISGAVIWSLLRTPRRRPDAALAFLAVVLGAASPSLHRSSISGASQRLLWLTLLAWLLVTAVRLTSGSTCHVRAPSAPTVTIET